MSDYDDLKARLERLEKTVEDLDEDVADLEARVGVLEIPADQLPEDFDEIADDEEASRAVITGSMESREKPDELNNKPKPGD